MKIIIYSLCLLLLSPFVISKEAVEGEDSVALRGKRDLKKKDETLAEIIFEDGSNVKWLGIEDSLLKVYEVDADNDDIIAFLLDEDEDPIEEFKRLKRNPNAVVPPGLVKAAEKIKKEAALMSENAEDEDEDKDEEDPNTRSLATFHDNWWLSYYCTNPAYEPAMLDCRCFTYLRYNTGPFTYQYGGEVYTHVYNIGDSTGQIGFKLEKEVCFFWDCHWELAYSTTVPRGRICGAKWTWMSGAPKRRSRTFGATGELYDYSYKAISAGILGFPYSVACSTTNF